MICEWCGAPSEVDVIVERRRSSFSTNTKSGRVTVKADYTARACAECAAGMVLTPRERAPKVGRDEAQMTVDEVLRSIEKEGS